MNEDKKFIAYCGLYCGDYVQIYFEKSINKKLKFIVNYFGFGVILKC